MVVGACAAGCGWFAATRSLDPNGFENGVSANRIVSVLHAEARPPINPTRAIRDTATQRPAHTRSLITLPTQRDFDEGIKGGFRLSNRCWQRVCRNLLGIFFIAPAVRASWRFPRPGARRAALLRSPGAGL